MAAGGRGGIDAVSEWDGWDGTKGSRDEARWITVRVQGPEIDSGLLVVAVYLPGAGMADEPRSGQACRRCTGLAMIPAIGQTARANEAGESEASTALVRPVPPHPGRVGSHQRGPPGHRDRQVSTTLAPGTEHSACKCSSSRGVAASFRHAGGNTNASSVLQRSRRGTSSLEPQKPSIWISGSPH